jgi:hypothetical protein
LKTSNINELLIQERDVQLVTEGNSWQICCRICDEFIKSSHGLHKAYGGTIGGSLSKGLDLKSDFSLYEAEHNETWFQLKNRIL